MKGCAATEVFSTAYQQLWTTATQLVELVPESWEVRCHELARAVGSVLDLPVQDGQFGSIEHSWLWVGPRPRPKPCERPSRLGEGPCQWEALFTVSSMVKSKHRPTMQALCAGHKADVLAEQPLAKWMPLRRHRHVILDVYFPAASPPVVLVDMYAKLPLTALYRPGGERTDIDRTRVGELTELFRKSGLVQPSLDRVSRVDPPTPPPPQPTKR